MTFSNVPFSATTIVGRERFHQSVMSHFPPSSELRPYIVSDPAKPPMVPSQKKPKFSDFFLQSPVARR